ncbi:hypothetical protein IGI96_000943 [Enterococcus sp. DIV0421]
MGLTNEQRAHDIAMGYFNAFISRVNQDEFGEYLSRTIETPMDEKNPFQWIYLSTYKSVLNALNLEHD